MLEVREAKRLGLISVRLLAAAIVLAGGSYGACLLLFGSTYFGESADPLLAATRDSHFGLWTVKSLKIIAAYAAGYCLLLAWAQGCLLGIDALWRRLRHRWAWRLLFTGLGGSLLFLQAVAIYPAMLEGQFDATGGIRAGLQDLAVTPGPVWILPLVASPLGYLVYLARRFGRALWQLLPIGIGVVVVAGLSLGGHRSSRLPAPLSPNLLILASDSLRGDHLEAKNAPTILGLARRGVFIPRWRMSVARTETAWVSVFSGLWPFQHGVRHMFPTAEQRRRAHPSFIRALAERGHRTLVVGDYGSESFYASDLGFDVTDVARFDIDTLSEALLLRANPPLAGYLALPLAARLFGALRIDPAYVNAVSVTERLLDHLDEQPPGRPFAAVAIYSATHLPYASPHPYYDASGPGPHRFAKQNLRCDPAPPTTEEVRRVRALYDAGVRVFDDQVAIVLAYLRERGALDDTLVIIMGDHGEELYDDGRTSGHGDHLLGASNQTALIWNGPGIAPLSGPVNARLRDIDLAPTLSELFGLGDWPGPGESFAGLLFTGARPADRDMYYETGIWIDEPCPVAWQKRISYPNLVEACGIDLEGFISLRPELRDLVISAKHRAIETAAGRLVYMPTLYGADWKLASEAPLEAEEREALVDRLRSGLEALTGSADEVWVGDRIAPGTGAEVGTGAGLYLLELSHDLDEENAAHYTGTLWLDTPARVSFGDGRGTEGREIPIDIHLRPGTRAQISFRADQPICHASLSLAFDGEPLTAVDLFTGSLALRPFTSFADMDLCRHRRALLDRGGFRPRTALWLGWRGLP